MNNEFTTNLPIEVGANLESTGALELYLNELRKTPLLSREDEADLFKKLHQSDLLMVFRDNNNLHFLNLLLHFELNKYPIGMLQKQ